MEYYLTVTELRQREPINPNERIRVSGQVEIGSVHYDVKNNRLTFRMTDLPESFPNGMPGSGHQESSTDKDLKRVRIEYQGIKPDLLREGSQAIVSGHMTSEGILLADEVLTKCPSKYEASFPSQIP